MSRVPAMNYEYRAIDSRPDRPLGMVMSTHETPEEAQAAMLKDIKYSMTFPDEHKRERIVVHVARHRIGGCPECTDE